MQIAKIPSYAQNLCCGDAEQRLLRPRIELSGMVRCLRRMSQKLQVIGDLMALECPSDTLLEGRSLHRKEAE